MVLGTETWKMQVVNPGNETGVSCVDTVKQLSPFTSELGPSKISCDGYGICTELRPCKLRCDELLGTPYLPAAPPIPPSTMPSPSPSRVSIASQQQGGEGPTSTRSFPGWFWALLGITIAMVAATLYLSILPQRRRAQSYSYTTTPGETDTLEDDEDTLSMT